MATSDNTIIKLKVVVVQQKLASCMREDIIYEVKAMADQEGIRVIGSPFEADSQLILLMNQGIVDFVVTNNSNISFQGCEATVMRLSKIDSSNKRKKRCCYVHCPVLLQELKEKFVAERELNNDDLSIFACMLGNNYIGRVKGEGFVSCTKKMTDYMECMPPKQADWINNNHVTKLDIENQKKFYSAFKHFLHGPAFIVVPNNATISPRDGWIQEPNSYSVDLKLMDRANNTNTVDFSMNNDDIHRSNLRIGCVPLLVL